MTSGAGEGGLAPAELEAQVDRSPRASGTPTSICSTSTPRTRRRRSSEPSRRWRSKTRGALLRRLGLSNFAAWECVRVHAMCDALGLPRPDTYQGMYNCVTRAVEPELLPALRALDMRFLAYNPLAGGLLTGKHEAGGGGDKNASSPRRGRFSENKMYPDRFWRPEYFAAVDAIAAACGKHEGLTVAGREPALVVLALETGRGATASSWARVRRRTSKPTRGGRDRGRLLRMYLRVAVDGSRRGNSRAGRAAAAARVRDGQPAGRRPGRHRGGFERCASAAATPCTSRGTLRPSTARARE